MQPTVFADVDNSMTIAQEEIFGPVLAVIPYDTEDDAMASPTTRSTASPAACGPPTRHGCEDRGAIRTGTYAINM